MHAAEIHRSSFYSRIFQAFGGILFIAGKILSNQFERKMKRHRWHWLVVPWGACIFWSGLCYGWMSLTALVYQTWNRNRLGRDGAVSFQDAFWWSYLTANTVGLVRVVSSNSGRRFLLKFLFSLLSPTFISWNREITLFRLKCWKEKIFSSSHQ